MGVNDRLVDRNGIEFIERHAHVKIVNRRHLHFGMTGTVVRFDVAQRRVWVTLPGGMTIQVGPRSLEVLP